MNVECSQLVVATRANLSGFVLCWLRTMLVQTRRRIGAGGLGGWPVMTAAGIPGVDSATPIGGYLG